MIARLYIPKINTSRYRPLKEISLNPYASPLANTDLFFKGNPIEELQVLQETVAPSFYQCNQQAYRKTLAFVKTLLKNQPGRIESRLKSWDSCQVKVRQLIRQGKIENQEDLEFWLWDIIGTRLILKEGSPEALNKLVSCLLDAKYAGKLQFVFARNTHGVGVTPYLDNNLEYWLRRNCTRGFYSSDQAIKPSGYTTLNLYLQRAENGQPIGPVFNLQIRGPMVHSLAEIEHEIYSIRQGKPVTKALKPVATVLRALDERAFKTYLQYLTNAFQYARNLELNQPSMPSAYPAELPEVLRLDKLASHHKKLTALLQQTGLFLPL